MTDYRMMPWSQPGEVEEDGDQGFAPWTGECTRSECQTWEGRLIVRPKLERNKDGFWCCPKCHSRYGRKWWEAEPEEDS